MHYEVLEHTIEGPTFMVAKPMSHPLMTLPCPSWKTNSVPLSLELSNFVPSSKVPV